MTIGVFDSGIGGWLIAEAIQAALPHVKIVYKNDAEHVPYGDKSLEDIYRYTLPIVKSFQADGCDVVVIACNTVTTNFIEKLRAEMPMPLVGMEPMVKPASLATKTGVIAVCATPRTLESPRYHQLKAEYASEITVLEPDCSDWAAMIEADEINRRKISHIIEDVCSKGADQIVLGCTHYHWIDSEIRILANGRAAVLQPEEPVIAQLKKVISSL